MYARVLRGGEIRTGDPITVLPPSPGSRAVEEMLLSRLDRAEMKSSVAAWKAARDAGFAIEIVEDGDLAMSSTSEIPGPAFNHAAGLAQHPNLLSTVTDFFDAQGTPAWLSMDEAPWQGAQPDFVLDIFGAPPGDVAQVPPPPGVVIRRLEPDEAGTYTSVRSGNTTAGGVTEGGPDPWPQVYTHLAQTRNRHLFMAEIDGEPVANASLHVSGRTGWMRGALVAPDARGRGIQRALIFARARAAAESGCDLVGASAEPGEISARNLERAGLRRVGSRSYYIYEPGS
jgi:GNAT superfamily N-acetyltransferase